jgi:hypothetical protein
LPVNITTPGTYVLTGNLSYSVYKAPAIVIANNVARKVIVDLNGFTPTGALRAYHR